MNNKQDFFNNDVEINVNEDEIVLATPTELFEEAREIAQSTHSDEKFPFTLQYDSNQKEFLLSMLRTVGAIVEDDDDDGHILATMMNMTQLAFIKQLDCVERVKTDEGINPFLAEEAVKLTPVQEDQQEEAPLDGEVQEVITDIDDETLEVQTELVVNRTVDANLEVITPAEVAEDNDGIAVASVAASARSSCSSCPTNTSQSNAQNIAVETLVSGCICCPGTEQWFKFTVPQTKKFTIFTTGSLDTIGTLSGGSLSESITNDDCAGRVNFRIVETLSAGEEYYIKIGAKNGAIGSYTLKVTAQSLAEEVLIHSNSDDEIVVLEQGKTYELPRGEGYSFLNVANTENAPLTVEVTPDTTTDKRVYWYASTIPADPVDINFDWYDNTAKYQTITANSCGGTKLYACDWFERGKRGEVCVAVIPNGGSLVKATGISLDHTSLKLGIGENQKIIATVSPGNATVQDVEWVSDNPNIATVTPFGRVEAIAPGTTTIRAKAMDGSGAQAICTVTVLPAIKDNVEYHLLCNGDNNNALRVGFRNVLEFEYISPVRGERLSYWNRQKWVVKSEGESKKIYTKLDKTYCLSNISGKAYVSNNATNNNAELTIAPHGNSGDDCTIKLTNQNLYLTLVHGNYQDVTGLHADCNGMTACWGEWKEYNSLDPSNQIWQFVEQPANHHYGVDTYGPIDNAVASALKNDGYDFIIRYYTSLSEQDTGKLLKDTEVSTLHNANLKIVSVYQDNGRSISDFSIEKANLHAERAMELAESLGQPKGGVIYFGVDFSPSSSELGTIAQYFNTINNKLSGKYRIGVYGTAEVCDRIKPNFASHSWLSHDIRSNTDSIEGTPEYISYDSLLKYDIKQAEKTFYNSKEFDYDTAIGDDYGQW